MSVPTTETATIEEAAAPETAVDRVEPTLDELKAALDELGLTPGQIKGRLEASKKNEQRAKDNADKAKRFDEIEEANKTEQQKLIERAERAEKVIAERDAKEATAQLIADVAKEKGVPANALRGATREDLESHADELLALIPVPPVAPSADGQGAVGEPIGGVTQITSAEQLKSMSPEQIEAARKDGSLDKLMGKS